MKRLICKMFGHKRDYTVKEERVIGCLKESTFEACECKRCGKHFPEAKFCTASFNITVRHEDK